MILTLTANPSIDRTIAVPSAVVPGAVHRVAVVASQAAGKGINVSRLAAASGCASTAVFPAPPDSDFVAELESLGVRCRTTAPAGEIRINIAVTDPDGVTTKFNEPGPQAGAEHLDAMRAAVLSLVPRCTWVVLAGSLPAGAPDHFYRDLVADLGPSSASVAVDTSNGPLNAITAGLGDLRVDLMKPNHHELASMVGIDAAVLDGDPDRVAEAAMAVVDRGVGAVLATLGAHGAVLATSAGVWHAAPPRVEVASTVGAGDSSLFGYLVSALDDGDEPARLRSAAAWGAAAAALPGSTLPRAELVDLGAVVVRRLGPPRSSSTPFIQHQAIQHQAIQQQPVQQQGEVMPSKSVIVGSSVGLHARPAAIISEAAGELSVPVTLNGANAASSLMIMSLGAKCGDTVEVASEDEAAVETIAALVEADLDAD